MDFQYKNVLIAIDGSEPSEKAFDRAVHIAKRDKSQLILAHIVDTQNFSIIKSYLDNLNDVYKQAEIDAYKMLDKYAQIAKEAGVSEVKEIVKFGLPKNVLIDEIIPEQNVDVIILGATGTSAVERVFLGSVTDSAFRHSKCEVLVVR